MDGGWQNWIGTIVAMAAVYAAVEVMRLKKHIRIDDYTPTRKWKKAVSGPRYVPKHLPDEVPEHASEADWQFYQDFARVADFLNSLHKEEPWSFQDTGRLGGGYGEEAERNIEIRYNQQLTGWVGLTSVSYGEDSVLGNVQLRLHLMNARVFRAEDIFGMAQSLAQVVCDTPQEILDSKQQAVQQMVKAMWQVGEEAEANPELWLFFSGTGKWYFSHQ